MHILLPPMHYDAFAHLMRASLLILTDSGGIQEEASALHKPVIVMRNCTERLSITELGLGILAGTETDDIVSAVSNVLTNVPMFKRMSSGSCPYGDGHAADKIVSKLEKFLMKN